MKQEFFLSAQEKVSKALAATSGVRVTFGETSCPMCNIKEKKIMLPALPEKLSDDMMLAVRAWVDHETGHLCYTPDPSTQPKHKNFFFLNSVEDCRVSKMMSLRGLGIAHNLENVLTQYEALVTQAAPGESLKHAAGRVFSTCWYKDFYDKVHATLSPKVKQYIDAAAGIAKRIQDDELQTYEDSLRVTDELLEIWGKIEEEEPASDNDKCSDQKAESGENGTDKKDSSDSDSAPKSDEKTAPDKDGTAKKDSPDSTPSSKPEKGDDKQDASDDKNTEPKDASEAAEKDSVDQNSASCTESSPDSPAPEPRKASKTFYEALAEQLPTKLREGTTSKVVFTANDLEIHAYKPKQPLCGEPKPSSELIKKYSSVRDKVLSEVNVLRHKLMNDLLSTGTVWTRHKFEGSLDTKVLHKVGVGDSDIFQRKTVHSKLDTAVTILIDNSASMVNADKIRLARDTAILLSETLEMLRVPFECLGFTQHSDILSKKAHLTLGIPWVNYGLHTVYARTDPLTHYIFKPFNKKLVTCREAMVSIPDVHLYENIDGESLRWAAKRLIARPERRKIMFVLSDGLPAGTVRYPLHKDLRAAIAEVTNAGISTLGLGMDTDAVSKFYPRYVVVKNLDNFVSVAYKELTEALKERG